MFALAAAIPLDSLPTEKVTFSRTCKLCGHCYSFVAEVFSVSRPGGSQKRVTKMAPAQVMRGLSGPAIDVQNDTTYYGVLCPRCGRFWSSLLGKGYGASLMDMAARAKERKAFQPVAARVLAYVAALAAIPITLWMFRRSSEKVALVLSVAVVGGLLTISFAMHVVSARTARQGAKCIEVLKRATNDQLFSFLVNRYRQSGNSLWFLHDFNVWGRLLLQDAAEGFAP